MIHRRNFLLGLGAAVAAPAIVKVGSLMKLPPKRLLSAADIVNEALINAGLRDAEYVAFLEGMSQQIAYRLYYGDPEASPLSFTGLAGVQIQARPPIASV